MARQSDLKDKLSEKSLAKKNGGQTIFDLVKKQAKEIKRALPQQISSERFNRIILTAIRGNAKLQNCTSMSFLAAVMQSAQLGLEPNTPLQLAYLIPYGSEVQFQIGYQGMLELAYRTGAYRSIYAKPVYKGDQFEYEYGLEEKLVHVPGEDPEGDPTHYYAVYHLQNGGHGFVVASKKTIEQHRDKFSQAYKRGGQTPWKSDFDSMALKTVLKQLLKYAPKSVEFARAISGDETIKHTIDADMSEVQGDFIDVTPNEPVDSEPAETEEEVEF